MTTRIVIPDYLHSVFDGRKLHYNPNEACLRCRQASFVFQRSLLYSANTALSDSENMDIKDLKHTFRVSFALHKRNTHKRKYYTSTKYDCTHNIAFYSKKQSANNRASFFAQSERQILYKKRASVQKERTCLLHFFYASWQSFYTPECRKLSLP